MWNIRIWRRDVRWSHVHRRQRRDRIRLARVDRNPIVATNHEANFIVLRSKQQLSVFVSQIAGIIVLDFCDDVAAQQLPLSRAVRLDLEIESEKFRKKKILETSENLRQLLMVVCQMIKSAFLRYFEFSFSRSLNILAPWGHATSKSRLSRAFSSEMFYLSSLTAKLSQRKFSHLEKWLSLQVTLDKLEREMQLLALLPRRQKLIAF